MKHTVLTAVLALGVAMPAAAATNLAVNGSFESGDFSGWTQIAPSSLSLVQCGPFLGSLVVLEPTDGECFAALAAPGYFTTLRQVVPTKAGRKYRLDFTFTGGFLEASYAFSFDNVVLGGGIQSAPVYRQHFSYDSVATGSSATLEFAVNTPREWVALDGVSVVELPVPEPATWAMMIGGFAMTGLALRRGRRLARTL